MKICFLSLSSYPILTGKNLGYVGGAEIQQVLLVKELVKHGYDIYFVTYCHGARRIENIDGIKIIKTYEYEKIDKINTLVKYISIFSALKKANADIYFHSAGASGVLPVFCHLNRKKFVFRIPSDAIVLSKSLSGTYTLYKKIIDISEIKRADVVIAQSKFQKKILEERFKVKSVVIKNAWKIPPEVNYKKSDPPIVLWVGSLSSNKRPHLFLKLAKSIPYAFFEMIGGVSKREASFSNCIKSAMEKLPNFKYLGFVPPEKIDEYFQRASIFVNTSIMEGFPNTFLQAWSYGVPVVSLNVDPDGIICKHRLGFHSKTFQQLICDVKILLENETLRREMGNNGRYYIMNEHDITKITRKYINLFNRCIENG